MKIFFLLTMLSLSSSIYTQSAKTKTLDSTKKVLIVEASCGECQFKMKGKGCTLAIRIEGKSYFVGKANIDDFGDAHSNEGFCNAIRTAKVQGQIVGDKFIASFFEIIDTKLH